MLVELLGEEEALGGGLSAADLVEFYKRAKKRFDADAEFRDRAREGVVRLQRGDEESLKAWTSLCDASRVEFNSIYQRLNVCLEERGESFYNPLLKGIVEELEQKGMAVPSDGAIAIFLGKHKNRDGTDLPLIIKKSDGGYNYATTDLAAIKHRVGATDDGERADRVLYVTDAGQSQHFDMVFEAAKRAQYFQHDKKEVSLEHVPFGLVQGADGKKFATRSGDTVKLKDLLDEAVLRARTDLAERSDSEFDPRLEQVAQTVAMGAVKYADLSMNRESNYRFSYERMLSLNGNTAPYMLYAYARICGIIRKAISNQGDTQDTLDWPPPSQILITHDSELNLIRNLVKLPDLLAEVERGLYPNKICDYLFETSQKFNKFYESCSVNKAETPELKASRLTLCTVTASTIELLMGILGIPVVERL